MASASSTSFRNRFHLLYLELLGAPFVPSLISGMIVAMMASVMGISFSALVFGGEFSDWIPYAVSLSLLGAVLLGGGAALLSPFPGNITVPQDRLIPIIALMAAAIATALRDTVPHEEIARTILAAIAATSLLTGLVFYLLGRFGLGNLIRFIPYPVVGGFLAGSGWLLFAGSFRVMAGRPLELAALPFLARPEVAMLWMPGLLFGLALWAVLRWRPHVLAVPSLLVAGVGLFYLVTTLLGLPLARMQEEGWLLKSLPSIPVTELHGVFGMHGGGVRWGIIASQGGFFAALLLTAIISLLLNTTAIEISADREIDLNAELRVAGLANLAAGAGGSSPGFIGLSLTRLPLSFGASNRLTGLIYAACCGLILLCGTAFLAYIPKFILGGFLLYLGFSMFVEWVVDGRKNLPAIDYGVMLLILVVIGTVGYLQGIATGIIASSTLFIIGYSRINVVARSLTGAEQRSHVDRSDADTHLLYEKGRELLILKLQGFIFFGSANALYDAVQTRVALAGEEPLRFVMLDFGQVTGLDSSALLSLVKMRKLGAKRGFRLVFVLASSTICAQLTTGGLLGADDSRLFPDRDHGLEWCEDQILLAARSATLVPAPEEDASLFLHLQRHWPAGSDPTRLDRYLEKVVFAAGDHLLRQGEPARELYFIEEGRVRVEVDLGNGRVVRLRTLLAGTVVGELGFYLHSVRTATVRAETSCHLRRLTETGLKQMEEEEPGAALVFHHYMSRLLADRMTHTNRALQAALE